MTAVIQILIDALSLGAMYALYSLGVALIFGVSGIVNFAYGNFIAAGAYLLLLMPQVPGPVVVAGVLVAVIALGMCVEFAVFGPARSSGADETTILIIAFAVSMFIENLLLLKFGARPVGADFGASLASTAQWGTLSVGWASVVTVAVVAGALATLAVLLRWTQTGLLIRAAALDPVMLQMLGVSPGRVVVVTVALSCVLAGLAALMLVAQTGSLSLSMGVQPVLIAFIGTVLGGLGSLSGAVIASFGLALVTVLLQELLPGEWAPFRTAILFTLVIVVLLVRPDGLVRTARGARI